MHVHALVCRAGDLVNYNTRRMASAFFSWWSAALLERMAQEGMPSGAL
jgi:hypothetical protein